MSSVLVIPAALNLGVLSGLGLVAGLYGALIVATLEALVCNNQGIVSGCTSMVYIVMGLVVAEYTQSAAEAFAVATLFVLMQIAMGVLGMGRYISDMRLSVVNGFFTGIGIASTTIQIAPALGVPNVSRGVTRFIASLPFTISHAKLKAAPVAATCLAVAVLWRGPTRRFGPAFLVTLIAGIPAGFLLFRHAPVSGDISVGVPIVE